MTRIWIPIVTILLFALLLLALAFLMFGTAQPKPLDPFAEYADYLPGAV